MRSIVDLNLVRVAEHLLLVQVVCIGYGRHSSVGHSMIKDRACVISAGLSLPLNPSRPWDSVG